MADAPLNGDPRKPGPKGKTLVGILGAVAAMGTVVQVARTESSRTVTATVSADGHVHTTNLRGKIYLKAYRDTVKVSTACDGLTRNLDGSPIRTGQRFTEAQCDAMLEASLIDTADHVMACSAGLHGEGHDNERIAAMLLAHNIGWPRYCRSASSPRVQFNQGRYRAACGQFIAWRFAGGRPVLEGRRRYEISICMKDVR